MSQKPPTACRSGNCGGYAVDRGYCQACLKDRRVQSLPLRELLDKIDKMYHTKAWERCSKTCRTLNGLCQRVNNGVQCRYPAAIVHHLISPRIDVSKFYDPANLVAVCRQCHPNTPGEPVDENYEYVPTRGLMGRVYVHPKPVAPGQVRITDGIAVIGQL